MNSFADSTLKAADPFDPDTAERLAAHEDVLRTKPEVVQVFREIQDEFLLLESRFVQCEAAIRVELGSGVFALRNQDPSVLASEVVPGANVDLIFDGTQMPFPCRSVSALFLQNVFHHFSNPAHFFDETLRVLMPGGVVVLFEPYYGLFAKVLYPRLFATETFDKRMSGWTVPPVGPMSGANQALSYIVFERDRSEFTTRYPELEMVSAGPFANWPRYLASGGLNFRRVLPKRAFPALCWLEPRLGRLHRVFGLHQFIVLRHRA